MWLAMTYLSCARKRSQHHRVLWIDVLYGAGDVLPQRRSEIGVVHRFSPAAQLLVLQPEVDLLAIGRLVRQVLDTVVDGPSSPSAVYQVVVDHQGVVVVVVQSVVAVAGIFGGCGAGRVLIRVQDYAGLRDNVGIRWIGEHVQLDVGLQFV